LGGCQEVAATATDGDHGHGHQHLPCQGRRPSTSDDDDDNGGGGRGGVDSSDQSPKLFVFGDSFADAGNTLKGPLGLNTRGWYEPCGVSDARHGNKPTGRCSDGMVQSDFLCT